jgi:hypothetical protein
MTRYDGPSDYDGNPVTEAALQHYAILMLLEDTDFLRSFNGVLKPDHFKSPEFRYVASFALDFFKAHHRAPTLEALRIEIDSPRMDWAAMGVQPALMDRLVDILGEDAAPGGALAKYIHDRTEHWVQLREFEYAHRVASEHLDQGDVEGAFAVVLAAQRVRAKANEWLVFPDDLQALFEYYSQDNIDRISVGCGIPKLDHAMEGGLRPGELGVWMAPLKRGKSMALVNTGAEALRKGINIVHYSLENSSIETLARYVRNIGGDTVRGLLGGGTPQDQARLAAGIRTTLQLGDSDAKGFIKWFPAGVTTVDEIDADLEELQEKQQIGLVIVDYGDLMRSRERYEKQYENQTAVFSELRDLGTRHGVPVWTASQSNRDSMNPKNNIQVRQMAEAIGKAMKADFIIAMNQDVNEADLDPPIMRLSLIAARRGKGHCTATVEARFDRAQLIETFDSEEGDEDAE